MKLSTHFELSDLVVTSLKLPNTPTAVEVANLKRLAVEVLEPLYTQVGPFKIESAFRGEDVNRSVGGSPASFHRKGQAADLVPTMGAEKFYAIVAAKHRHLVGELILNSPRVLHVTLPQAKSYPLQLRDPASGKYRVWDPEELKAFLSKYGQAVAGGVGVVAVAALGLWAINR